MTRPVWRDPPTNDLLVTEASVKALRTVRPWWCDEVRVGDLFHFEVDRKSVLELLRLVDVLASDVEHEVSYQSGYFEGLNESRRKR